MLCRIYLRHSKRKELNTGEVNVKTARKKAVFLAILIFTASWCVMSCEKATSAVRPAGSAADFTLKDTDGEDYNFKENAGGKVVILNFWAQRCPACKMEIPNLVDLYEEYGDDGLEIIGIDVDGGGIAAMNSAISRYGINYPLLSGTSSEIGEIVSGYGGFRFIPTTYIISREGKIVEKVSGPKGKEYLEAAVKKLL
jgi:peroxiredoxin